VPEQTDAITNEVLEPMTFVLAHPTVFEASAVSFTTKTLKQWTLWNRTVKVPKFSWIMKHMECHLTAFFNFSAVWTHDLEVQYNAMCGNVQKGVNYLGMEDACVSQSDTYI